MIKIFILVLVLILGLFVGPEFAGNQGYVLISIANQTLEMSVTTLGTIIFLLILGLFILEFVIRKLFSIPTATTHWVLTRKTSKARALTQTGLLKLLEGDWKQAEKLAIKGAENSDAPLLNYLAAAEAAQYRGDIESRDHYLQQASDMGQNNLATALTRAKLQYHQGQYEEALASLKDLQEAHPRNKVMLSLLKDTHIKLNDWQALLKLMPTLTKNDVVTEEQAAQLNTEAECGLMSRIASQQGSAGLLTHWNSLSRSNKQQKVLITCLTKELIKQQADADAYSVLRDAIKKYPEDELIALIPQLNLEDYQPVIIRLSEMLRNNENNSAIHSALGQLYFRIDDWQKAREHFEMALKGHQNVEDYARLVDTLEKLDDSGAANLISREALKIALPNKA